MELGKGGKGKKNDSASMHNICKGRGKKDVY
jgi:hypothetical protein